MKRTLAALGVLLILAASLFAFDTKPTPVLPDGATIQLPLPTREHMQNVGGSDGAGLCVYTSVTLAAKWHNITEAYSLRKFAEGRPGGSYPEKLAKDLETYSLRYNVKLPTYVQHTGGDDAFLDLCVKTRRYPSITYAGVDDFYSGVIAHMVNLPHLDAKYGTIQDNNRAGRWTTDTRARILNRWKGLDDRGNPLRIGRNTIGGGWAFVWIAPPPPPGKLRTADEELNPQKLGSFERIVIGDSYKAEWDERGLVVWVYWLDGVAVGGFHKGRFYDLKVNPETGAFTDLGDEKPAPPGVCPPCCDLTDEPNNGIILGQVSNTPRYWINGVEVSRATAYAAVSDTEGLVDDSDKYHLSIVGFSGAEKSQILLLFAPGGKLEKYARRLHIQVYAADAWPATDILASTVTLQEPANTGGKIVGTASDWTDESLKKVLGDVFDKPEPVKPEPPIMPAPSPPTPVDPAPAPTPIPVRPALPDWLLGLLGLLALWFVRRK